VRQERDGNLVTVDARVIAQMLQREQQLVAVLAEHAHADGEHSTGYAGDDYELNLSATN
jgi:hypothetical protein